MPRTAGEQLLDNLNALLRTHGISRCELARRAGLPQTTVNRVFQTAGNGVSPTLGTLERIARGFGLSIADLLTQDAASVKTNAIESSRMTSRQLARLTEDFLLSSEAERKEILRIAEESASRTLKGER